MSAALKFSLLPLLLLAACSSAPKPSTSSYHAPAVAPVREKISSAQGHTAKIKQYVATIHDAIDFAADTILDPPALKLALEGANTEIDALTADLLSAQERVTQLEAEEKTLAQAANNEAEAKRIALARAEKLDAQRRHAVSQRNKLLLATIGLALWIARKPLISGAGFIVRKFAGVPW